MFIVMAYDLPSCEDCKRVVYEGHKTGKAHIKMTASGKTFPRPPNMPTPCYECPKLTFRQRQMPNANQKMATEATDSQLQALHYYRMMKYDRAGKLPYDSLTLQNNVTISMAEEEAKEQRTSNQPVVVVTKQG